MDIIGKIDLVLGEGKKQPFKVGDKVKVAPDALRQHARSVPAHMGYTKEQFSWRDAIKKAEGKVGVVTQVFSSGNTDIDFGSGIIMMDANMLVKA